MILFENELDKIFSCAEGTFYPPQDATWMGRGLHMLLVVACSYYKQFYWSEEEISSCWTSNGLSSPFHYHKALACLDIPLCPLLYLETCCYLGLDLCCDDYSPLIDCSISLLFCKYWSIFNFIDFSRRSGLDFTYLCLSWLFLKQCFKSYF